MVWTEKSTVSLRQEFVHLACQDGANVRALCWRFVISAKTGYKWIERFDAADGNAQALLDRGRRPHPRPRAAPRNSSRPCWRCAGAPRLGRAQDRSAPERDRSGLRRAQHRHPHPAPPWLDQPLGQSCGSALAALRARRPQPIETSQSSATTRSRTIACRKLGWPAVSTSARASSAKRSIGRWCVVPCMRRSATSDCHAASWTLKSSRSWNVRPGAKLRLRYLTLHANVRPAGRGRWRCRCRPRLERPQGEHQRPGDVDRPEVPGTPPPRSVKASSPCSPSALRPPTASHRMPRRTYPLPVTRRLATLADRTGPDRAPAIRPMRSATS